MRVLVTGGNGMVGQHICKHPAAASHKLSAPSRAELDLSEKGAIRHYISDFRPDAIIHSAGRVAGIIANDQDPEGFLLSNLDMGRNIVLAARDANVAKLINLGSSCMYPPDAPNPLDEDYLLAGKPEPTNEGYALAKLVVAKLCDYVSRSSGIQYKTLIPCNLYGPHDKYDPDLSHMLPAIIRKIHEAAANGAEEVEVWGDGTARREYLYAGDLADGIWHALDHYDAVPQFMNIGTGKDLTVIEYYQAVAAAVGWKGRFTRNTSRPVGMKRKLLSVACQERIGWHPKTSLTTGIGKTYEDFKRRFDRNP